MGRWGFFRKVFIVSLFILIAGCEGISYRFCSLMTGCDQTSYNYYKANRSGRFTTGMTQQAVKEILGEPTGIERQLVSSDDFREVFVYHIKNLDPRNHLYPTIHLFVFSNGKLIARNPSDPYATELRGT